MSDDTPVWLEVALNGAAGRTYQPGIPVRPEEIIEEGVACAKAGAAIIHLHVYNDDGQPVEDAQIYKRVFEGIREQCDAIIYPTLALNGDLAARYAPIKELAAAGLLEWGVIDPGSVNITHKLQVAMGADGFVYPNPDEHIREGLKLAEENDWRPAYAIYEPGFARLGAAWAEKYPALKKPVYRVMFSDNLLFGMPPTEKNLEFYAGHLAVTAPDAPWMLSGLDANVEDLIDAGLNLGAHVRVGLEDAPFGTEKSNLDMVQEAVKKIEASARTLASPETVRNAD